MDEEREREREARKGDRERWFAAGYSNSVLIEAERFSTFGWYCLASTLPPMPP